MQEQFAAKPTSSDPTLEWFLSHCHIHIIPRYKGDVENPSGGIRGVIPNKKEY